MSIRVRVWCLRHAEAENVTTDPSLTARACADARLKIDLGRTPCRPIFIPNGRGQPRGRLLGKSVVE